MRVSPLLCLAPLIPLATAAASLALADANASLLYSGSWAVLILQGIGSPASDAAAADWPHVAAALAPSNSSLRFAAIDARSNRVAATLLEVKALPAVKVIVDGKVFTHSGPLDRNSIVRFILSDYSLLRWFNRLPLSYSVLNWLQYEVYFWVQDSLRYLSNLVPPSLYWLNDASTPSSDTSTTDL